jgi:hypothetical protein
VAGTDYNGINIGQGFAIVAQGGGYGNQKVEVRRDAPLTGSAIVTAVPFD